MFELRIAERSLRDSVADFFKSGTLLAAYNVYDEDDLRRTDPPVWPHIFVLRPYVEFVAHHLPVIVTEITGYRKYPIELGGAAIGEAQASLHIFGRNRSERDDLAGALMHTNGLKQITLRDYGAAGQPVIGTAGLIPSGRDYWRIQAHTVGQDLQIESSLANWLELMCSFIVAI